MVFVVVWRAKTYKNAGKKKYTKRNATADSSVAICEMFSGWNEIVVFHNAKDICVILYRA